MFTLRTPNTLIKWQKCQDQDFGRTKTPATFTDNMDVFDTTKEEHQMVLDLLGERKWNYSHVWTVVEGDSGKWVIIEGWHAVNRQLYMVTEEPWQTRNRMYEIEY